MLVSNSSGWIADGLANSGTLTMTQTRKLLQVVGSVGPGETDWQASAQQGCSLAGNLAYQTAAARNWPYATSPAQALQGPLLSPSLACHSGRKPSCIGQCPTVPLFLTPTLSVVLFVCAAQRCACFT